MTDPQSVAVISRIIDESLTPLFVTAVIGAGGWVTWVSWQVRHVIQTLDSINDQLRGFSTVREDLAQHKIEDAAEFARIETRVDSLEREVFKAA